MTLTVDHLIHRLEAINADPAVAPEHRKTAADGAFAVRLAHDLLKKASADHAALRQRQAELHQGLVERLARLP